jgi:hypothetical protein
MRSQCAARSLSEELISFFEQPQHVTQMLKVLRKKRKDDSVSLRMLDFFVVNYAAEFNVAFPHPITGHTFEVYRSYEQYMKTYHKAFFDPFRRGAEEDRLDFEFTAADGSRDALDTTLAQLNFFRWIIHNGILHYVEQHHKVICTAMKEHGKRPREAVRISCVKEDKLSILKEHDQGIQGDQVEDDENTSASTSTSFMEVRLGIIPRRRRQSRRSSVEDRAPARRTPLNGRKSYVVIL